MLTLFCVARFTGYKKKKIAYTLGVFKNTESEYMRYYCQRRFVFKEDLKNYDFKKKKKKIAINGDVVEDGGANPPVIHTSHERISPPSEDESHVVTIKAEKTTGDKRDKKEGNKKIEIKKKKESQKCA